MSSLRKAFFPAYLAGQLLTLDHSLNFTSSPNKSLRALCAPCSGPPSCLSPLPSIESHRAPLASSEVLLEASVERRARWGHPSQGRPRTGSVPGKGLWGEQRPPQARPAPRRAAPAKLGRHSRPDSPPVGASSRDLPKRGQVSWPLGATGLSICAAGMTPAPTAHAAVRAGRAHAVGTHRVSSTWPGFTTPGAPHLLRQWSFQAPWGALLYSGRWHTAAAQGGAPVEWAPWGSRAKPHSFQWNHKKRHFDQVFHF